MSEPAKRIYFVSLGCPKNRVDSEVMLGEVGQAGHEVVDDPADAEVIVVNTCGFIEAAKEESIETILEMAQFKDGGRCENLVVTGCLTQRYGAEVAREIPEIDHILGSADYGEIRRVVAADARRRVGLPVLTVSETPSYIYDETTPRVLTGARHSAYIKIAEGCDRPCAFCIIPKLRGPQRSRSVASICAEAEALGASGVRELNLIAQDLTRYGADRDDRPTLASLLRGLGEVQSIDWIRLHYTYPSAFTDELIDTIASTGNVLPYVDVPLQHIDDQLLKKMRRGHSARITYELIDRLRARIPGVVIRTTFIAGHPGETDEAFANLCNFVREAELDHVGVFPYSREEGTVAAMLPGRVPLEVAEERAAEVMEIQRAISRKKNEARVGTELRVMIDGESSESEYLLEGRHGGQAPEIDGTVYVASCSAQPGDMVDVVVTEASDYDLAAEPRAEIASA